jgi:hypothetical protein
LIAAAHAARPLVPEADQQVAREADALQPKNSCARLSAVTSISIAKLNSDRYSEEPRDACGHGCM